MDWLINWLIVWLIDWASGQWSVVSVVYCSRCQSCSSASIRRHWSLHSSSTEITAYSRYGNNCCCVAFFTITRRSAHRGRHLRQPRITLPIHLSLPPTCQPTNTTDHNTSWRGLRLCYSNILVNYVFTVVQRMLVFKDTTVQYQRQFVIIKSYTNVVNLYLL